MMKFIRKNKIIFLICTFLMIVSFFSAIGDYSSESEIIENERSISKSITRAQIQEIASLEEKHKLLLEKTREWVLDEEKASVIIKEIFGALPSYLITYSVDDLAKDETYLNIMRATITFASTTAMPINFYNEIILEECKKLGRVDMQTPVDKKSTTYIITMMLKDE